MADTGNGTTISFGTSGFTADFTEIDAGEQTRPSIDDSHLGTTDQETAIPGDLYNPGEITGIFHWDQSASTFPPIDGAAETVTITYPLLSGETVNATYAGTGFVTRAKGPVARNNELMMGEITVKWDGKTDAAFTAGS